MISSHSVVDCWDGGSENKNEPIIYHGYTITSKIFFKDAIEEAVKPYAFFKSKYPLILSIENHCSVEYQDKMADYLVNILGDMLYTELVDETKTKLPSPEELKNKILVKAKKVSSTDNQGIAHILFMTHTLRFLYLHII